MDETNAHIEFDEYEGFLWHKARFVCEMSVPGDITEPGYMTSEQRDDFIRKIFADKMRWYADNIDRFPLIHTLLSEKEVEEIHERDMRIDARNWQELVGFMKERI